MSQQSTASKPSLQGVRIKARKRTVKASAKHEPDVFRDQLLKHLETVPEGDFEGYINKLVQAGSTLELLKYADALFEILLVGGLLQPGGDYEQDGAPLSPFSIFKAKEPPELEDVKKYVEVLTKLIRRYKYLQKPLEENVLPSVLQYTRSWSTENKDKLAIATGVLMAQGFANTVSLQSLTKENIIKNDIAIGVLTPILRAYLAEQSMDHLAGALRKGGVKDLLAFFPPSKQNPKALEEHFRKEGLPQVADWYTKKQFAILKDRMVKKLREMCENEGTPAEIVAFIKAQQADTPLPESELIQCIWQGLMASVDWSARPDQIEGLALREVGKYAPVLQPFCGGAKIEVALINVVQVYCYEDTRIIKAFPQILKVLYNKDCISDQAIIYWHQKGAKPQGKQHFLKSTEALVKFLEEQEDSDEEEDE